MPRRKTIVKKNSTISAVISKGLIDLHFHGAFGIDLMRAEEPQLDELAGRLAQKGLAGFCPTTLSTGPRELLETVSRLGRWIQRKSTAPRPQQQAAPLGIHLEGPFINPEASGAHPAGVIRPLTLAELEQLWLASRKTIKIITLAPETLVPGLLPKLCRWAGQNAIALSLGHSRATEQEARVAFDSGMRGVTHAWNALPFHHRKPGPLGAALGRKDVYVEIIPDQVHVAPTLVRWTCQLHPHAICFVSDCAPAAATRSGVHPFGPLETRLRAGACRLPDGSLAGGGLLLPEAFRLWIENEIRERDLSKPAALQLLRRSLPFVIDHPAKALGLKIAGPKEIRWELRGSCGISAQGIYN